MPTPVGPFQELEGVVLELGRVHGDNELLHGLGDRLLDTFRHPAEHDVVHVDQQAGAVVSSPNARALVAEVKVTRLELISRSGGQHKLWLRSSDRINPDQLGTCQHLLQLAPALTSRLNRRKASFIRLQLQSGRASPAPRLASS